MLLSCGNEEALKTELTSVRSNMDSTTVLLNNQDSLLSKINQSFSSIDSNLININKIEIGLKQELTKKGKKNKDSIRTKVDLIREMMQRNDIHVKEVLSLIGDEESAIANLVLQAVQGVRQRILANNLRMANLNQDLGEMGEDNKFLFDEFLEAEMGKWNAENELAAKEASLKRLEGQVKEMDNFLNTAFMAMGTKRQLIRKGILENGGILNKKDLNEDLDRMAFEPLDIRITEEILLGKGKIQIITEHPTDSYTLETNDSETILRIDIPRDFWSLSKYLVVLKD